MENSAVGQDGELVQINVVMAHKLDQEPVIIRLLPMEGMIAKEIRNKVEIVNWRNAQVTIINWASSLIKNLTKRALNESCPGEGDGGGVPQMAKPQEV